MARTAVPHCGESSRIQEVVATASGMDESAAETSPSPVFGGCGQAELPSAPPVAADSARRVCRTTASPDAKAQLRKPATGARSKTRCDPGEGDAAVATRHAHSKFSRGTSDLRAGSQRWAVSFRSPRPEYWQQKRQNVIREWQTGRRRLADIAFTPGRASAGQTASPRASGRHGAQHHGPSDRTLY